MKDSEILLYLRFDRKRLQCYIIVRQKEKYHTVFIAGTYHSMPSQLQVLSVYIQTSNQSSAEGCMRHIQTQARAYVF